MLCRKVILILAAAAFAYVSPLFGQFRGDGFKQTVVGTPHDLSANANVTGATAICEFCHAPHKIPGMGNGMGPNPAVPLLWNVQLPTGPFQVYGGSAVFDPTQYGIRDPSTANSSKLAAYMTYLCLSCHDGSIGASSFYYNDVLGTIGTISPPNIAGNGVGLSNVHPVDFVYSAALAGNYNGLQTPTEGNISIPYVGKTTPLPLFKDQGSDTTGRLECATCHNPHNNTLNNGNFFLRMDNTGSALCLNCHGN